MASPMQTISVTVNTITNPRTKRAEAHTQRNAVSILAALVLAVLPCYAYCGDPPAGNKEVTAPPNDRNNYEGDRLVFPLRINATYDDSTNTPVCVKGDTALRGLGSVDNEDKIRFMALDSKGRECSGADLKTDVAIVVSNWSQISKRNPPDRYGLTYGAMVVPFKLQLSGNKDWVGGSSVGGYIGRRFAKSSVGAEISLVAFLGATTIPISQTVNGQNTTQSISGASAGFGLLGVLKDEFHLGIVVGWDHVGSGVGYQYNNKPWIAAEFGYDFSQ